MSIKHLTVPKHRFLPPWHKSSHVQNCLDSLSWLACSRLPFDSQAGVTSAQALGALSVLEATQQGGDSAAASLAAIFNGDAARVSTLRPPGLPAAFPSPFIKTRLLSIARRDGDAAAALEMLHTPVAGAQGAGGAGPFGAGPAGDVIHSTLALHTACEAGDWPSARGVLEGLLGGGAGGGRAAAVVDARLLNTAAHLCVRLHGNGFAAEAGPLPSAAAAGRAGVPLGSVAVPPPVGRLLTDLQPGGALAVPPQAAAGALAAAVAAASSLDQVRMRKNGESRQFWQICRS